MLNGPLTDAELSRLLADYCRIEGNTPEEQEAHDDAYMHVDFMVEDDPETAWRFLKLAASAKLSMHAAAFIAAGPLEDLLGRHGDAVIAWVEAEARRDTKVQLLLAMVWRGGMRPEIWARVEALRAELGIPSL